MVELEVNNMSLGFIYKWSYFFWRIKNKFKRSFKINFIVFQEGFLKISGVLLLIGWFAFLIIFYTKIIIKI